MLFSCILLLKVALNPLKYTSLRECHDKPYTEAPEWFLIRSYHMYYLHGKAKNVFITKCSLNSTNKIPHTDTIPTLSGYFPNKIDNAEVSTAAPPIVDVALSMKETVMNASRSTIRSQNLKDTKATDTSWFKKLKSLKEQNLEFEQFLLFGEIRRARIQKISGKKQWCREPLEWGARKKEHTPKNSNSLTSALRSQHKNIIGYRVVICQQLVIRINAIQRSRLIMADGLQVFDNSFWNQGILRRLKPFLLERTFFQFSTFRKISDCRSFTYLRTVTGSTPHTVSTSMALNSEPSVNRALDMRFVNHFAIAEGNL